MSVSIASSSHVAAAPEVSFGGARAGFLPMATSSGG
jgi:hypothetical protein